MNTFRTDDSERLAAEAAELLAQAARLEAMLVPLLFCAACVAMDLIFGWTR
ncbi:hypothetical protein [Variovorax rhizosphaerae]|uniref:Uncharacterized protein n=1 Tax=Variovorax rhizosphaerae TaxID=1836200 RepID=A0ABU8WQ22_9BURK